jgi:hypothetical protein
VGGEDRRRSARDARRVTFFSVISFAFSARDEKNI